MVKKIKLKTLIATSLSTVMLASSFYNVKAFDKTTLEKTLETSSIVNNTNLADEHKITLITGDVVTIKKIENGKSVINVEPSDQNGGGAQIFTIGEETYVIPTSAMPYLAADKLDKDLFNVTELIENGYDDKSLSSLPVIVEYTESKARAVQTKKADPKGAKTVRVLESINGAALATSKKEADTFWADITKEDAVRKGAPEKAAFDQGIEKIWLDGRVEAALDKSVPQIGAPTLWESGFTGKGVKVAVLDSGIDKNHPDLASQIDEAVSFVPGETVDDKHGHGTHVASTVLGTGAASEGKNKGVAPEARLLVGKVLNDAGSGLDSWIIDGMEWASDNAKIVSMSLGSSEPSDGTDPMAQAVNRLSEEKGALFVIAAGNSGYEGAIGSPGAADAALTIGAVDKSDEIAYFTSKGPRYGDKGLKPDLSAPGVDIVAARSGLSSGSGSYRSMSGTSMATPHVAGAAALLLQKNPDWNGTQLKEALMSTSKKLDYSPYHIGTGRLDVPAAANSTVRATGSLSFGFFKWPHDNAQPVQKTVTYTNTSDSAVTLNLQADFKTADGKASPNGFLNVSDSQITVPANGTKNVTVTLDPKLGELGARYEGHLTATDADGKQAAHTSMGMVKEEEKYPLTLNATDRNGNPTLTYVGLVNKDMDPEFVAVNGTTELRLKPGTYSAIAMMDVDTETDHRGVALVGDPEIKLDGPQTVELDARKAKEISVDVPKNTEPSYQRMEYYRSLDGKSMNDIYLMPVWIDKMYAAPTKKVENGEFEFLTRWRLIKPYLEINFKGKVLDDIPLAGSTPLDGKYNLSTVYAGNGTAADYENVNAKGKIVVVERNTEVTPPQQSVAAHEAGAKLLIIVNNEDKEFSVFAGNPDYTDIPLAVAGISKSEGDELIKAARLGNLNLNVEGEVNTPYVYDLMDVHQGSIPEDLTYAPENEELVKIDTRYKSDREAPGGEFRYDLRPHTRGAVGFLYKLQLPSVRTEWVSAVKDTRWYHHAEVLDSQWEVRQPSVTYEKGGKLNEDWFSPVVRPRLGVGYWTPNRQGNSFQFNIPAWADSTKGSTGGSGYDESVKNQTHKLYQGDTLIKEGKSQALNVFSGISEERKQYRLVTDAKRDPNRWDTSVSTHTEWTFWSGKGEDFRTLLPFYSLDYKVETDMNGDALAAPSTNLELSVAKLDGVEGYGKLEGAKLEISFNEGASWKTVKLERTSDDKWIAKINNQANAKYVSLRAAAWDDLGNKITQDVIKAYGLK
ncbi:S8 family serine peptidase [Fictibacillus barbaricus]|uniref:S8 family serine peptidase n=1 Tax=Fictibacillus barbaricus TaxID=182136 RepID=A0ABS2ZE50_9BACL|nr:S8 family serine peptidase [Fictibacillus barbaricus]MBN3544985.1 S8 family serine peptidase [Fictibacillus barbaricus]